MRLEEAVVADHIIRSRHAQCGRKTLWDDKVFDLPRTSQWLNVAGSSDYVPGLVFLRTNIASGAIEGFFWERGWMLEEVRRRDRERCPELGETGSREPTVSRGRRSLKKLLEEREQHQVTGTKD
jgi:hypothetical protein